MIKRKKIKLPRATDAEWLRLVEFLIRKYSTAVRTRGKYKGHRSTNSAAWIWELTCICQKYISKRAGRSKAYDGNMAIAALLGRVLVLWYCNVHRAKGFDPNRPLSRRQIFAHLAKYRAALLSGICDDRLMGAVWGKGQQWNFPFGKGAKGGKFV